MTSTTPLSGTVVTAYTYDAANRLTEREVSDSRTYTYTWSNRNQLLAEYTQGYPVRTFSYNVAGQMITATVFTLTTHFTYNGDGARIAVSVEGHGATTYTLDYAAGYRILAEQTGITTTLYLYGHECLGELRDDEWLYYLTDGTGYVRQGVDDQGEVVSVWLFDPDGTVLEGPEGPVSHLVCGGVYDWSTGLLYKDGRYFDPLLGIWLALTPLAVLQLWRRRKKGKGAWDVLLVALVVVGVGATVTGCNGIDWEQVERAACIEQPVDAPRASQKVNIYHVSGPNATVRGGFDWKVRFELESGAANLGYFFQEIEVTYLAVHDDGRVEQTYYKHFYEAWVVSEGWKFTNMGDFDLGARAWWNDKYYSSDQPVEHGKTTVRGVVKFYEGDLPDDFAPGNVPDAGSYAVSSDTQPVFWDGCGTTHDFEIEWDGESSQGYMQRGDQVHRFIVP